MQARQIAEKIGARVGQELQISFGETTATVIVVSVDPDGFICRIPARHEREVAEEFWLAYSEVLSVS